MVSIKVKVGPKKKKKRSLGFLAISLIHSVKEKSSPNFHDDKATRAL